MSLCDGGGGVQTEWGGTCSHAKQPSSSYGFCTALTGAALCAVLWCSPLAARCAAVGAWEEAAGQTGIAHLLEHMAFKGSPRTGTRDFSKEAGLLDAMDEGEYDDLGR